MEIHVVQPGQTLYSISRRYGLTPGLIARYNGLREPYRLAVGQSLLILQPLESYTVREGDTLYSIGRRFGVSVTELLRNNPNLGGQTKIFPGQVLVIRLEQAHRRTAELNGYAYPYVSTSVLRGILPYATWLTPFTYGFTAQGRLVAPEDEVLLALAEEYGVRSLLHLSTLTEGEVFSSARGELALRDRGIGNRLIEQVVEAMVAGGYDGVDVDFEFLGNSLAAGYADFVGRLRQAVNAAGGILVTALAPKAYAEQPGILYEGHDYRAIGEASDFVLLMTYEWGYTYGPPMAVAPLRSVRQVLDYAITEIPPEKIFLGFPNYAYNWTLPYRSGETRAELIGNEAAVELAVRVGAEIYFAEDAQTPYFYYTDADGRVHEVWFEDARSVLAKLKLVEQYGLHGVGVWNFMRPFTAAFSLMNYLYDLPERPAEL